ncbi:SDR family oxidoreductase [Aliishimia ponticola]|uniref:SDR family oxidoreductase n=1 Tax=Aliishimia ponticola TaxID=2499833 RepID=A0A4S4NF51_9RHOB|nr:SDR family oxidoreductase [Aliishimia ponticola]THH36768.1 SDR family oxidoreductase [Aliishimia ponticola]
MKTALITGAARGIGLATAKTLLDRGWHVAMVDYDGEELVRASEGLENARACITDVSKPDEIDALHDKLQAEWPALTALVNNAGIARFGPMADMDHALWREVMATNLDAPFLMVQKFRPMLEAATGASVVNITSISGLRASTLRVAYGTSKAALEHLTKQQAVELGEVGIRVNAVAPGPVRTKLAMAVHTQDIIDAYHAAIPLNRYGSEQELANAICFLVSEDASYITGQILAVDGGFESTGIGLPALRKDLPQS